jgi:hypothetical protein
LLSIANVIVVRVMFPKILRILGGFGCSPMCRGYFGFLVASKIVVVDPFCFLNERMTSSHIFISEHQYIKKKLFGGELFILRDLTMTW